MKILTFSRWIKILSVLFSLWVVSLLGCLLQGTEDISMGQVMDILSKRWGTDGGGKSSEVKEVILLQVRLPRLLLGAMVGGTLATVGAVLQALLRNPLADPFVIGVSSGTALGAVISLLLGFQLTLLGIATTPLFGFMGGLITLLFLYRLAQIHGKILVHTLLLAGVILNAMFSAVIMFITYMVDATKVFGIVYWLMGNIGSVEGKTLAVLAIYLAAGMGILLSLAKGLNLLTLGEEGASGLGLQVEQVKKKAFFGTALLTGAVVSVSGLISFVGIMIPHVLRILIGPDHRLLLPASFLGGGIFLMVADTLARVLIAPTEIPVGIITALCGGPFFLFLLRRGRMRFFKP